MASKSLHVPFSAFQRMRVYSKTLETFIKKSKKYAKDILVNEMGVDFGRSRIKFQGYTYPFDMVTFEDKSRVGYFEQGQYLIGLNKLLAYSAHETTLKNIIRHELAHYYGFMKYRNSIQHHGVEYREICKSFGWGEEVYSAKIDLQKEYESIEGELPTLKVLEKVKKLFKLADSSNNHESELAMQKANELLIRHNLEKYDDDNEEYFVKEIISAKKKTPLMAALYEILPLYLVRVVYNYTKQGVVLEVTGTRQNVELAQYVSDFLSIELERLYQLQRKINPNLKGVTAKNSFMRGIAEGYKEKIHQSKTSLSPEHLNALVVIEDKLEESFSGIYRRLSATYSERKNCLNSQLAGRAAGKRLNINPGVKNRSKTYLLD